MTTPVVKSPTPIIAHPLELQTTVITQEFNLSKFLGQVALGVVVTLSVREVIKRWDKFVARKNQIQN